MNCCKFSRRIGSVPLKKCSRSGLTTIILLIYTSFFVHRSTFASHKRIRNIIPNVNEYQPQMSNAAVLYNGVLRIENGRKISLNYRWHKMAKDYLREVETISRTDIKDKERVLKVLKATYLATAILYKKFRGLDSQNYNKIQNIVKKVTSEKLKQISRYRYNGWHIIIAKIIYEFEHELHKNNTYALWQKIKAYSCVFTIMSDVLEWNSSDLERFSKKWLSLPENKSRELVNALNKFKKLLSIKYGNVDYVAVWAAVSPLTISERFYDSINYEMMRGLEKVQDVKKFSIDSWSDYFEKIAKFYKRLAFYQGQLRMEGAQLQEADGLMLRSEEEYRSLIEKYEEKSELAGENPESIAVKEKKNNTEQETMPEMTIVEAVHIISYLGHQIAKGRLDIKVILSDKANTAAKIYLEDEEKYILDYLKHEKEIIEPFDFPEIDADNLTAREKINIRKKLYNMFVKNGYIEDHTVKGFEKFNKKFIKAILRYGYTKKQIRQIENILKDAYKEKSKRLKKLQAIYISVMILYGRLQGHEGDNSELFKQMALIMKTEKFETLLNIDFNENMWMNFHNGWEVAAYIISELGHKLNPKSHNILLEEFKSNLAVFTIMSEFMDKKYGIIPKGKLTQEEQQYLVNSRYIKRDGEGYIILKEYNLSYKDIKFMTDTYEEDKILTVWRAAKVKVIKDFFESFWEVKRGIMILKMTRAGAQTPRKGSLSYNDQIFIGKAIDEFLKEVENRYGGGVDAIDYKKIYRTVSKVKVYDAKWSRKSKVEVLPEDIQSFLVKIFKRLEEKQESVNYLLNNNWEAFYNNIADFLSETGRAKKAEEYRQKAIESMFGK